MRRVIYFGLAFLIWVGLTLGYSARVISMGSI